MKSLETGGRHHLVKLHMPALKVVLLQSLQATMLLKIHNRDEINACYSSILSKKRDEAKGCKHRMVN
ncbi:hypothetical protein T4A_5508 [Trichinella pseudospiralis]|uniref:Uncharacterized protein n=1 Tax=Trichinella pseudospiralis TaxID=6337 RepID=A0A0V1DZF3_TRIPS|nr:hypothetical protein T4A_5508 [Trichinella pseudospiralis]